MTSTIVSEIRAELATYATDIAETDKLDPKDLKPVLLGLFGEVGSLMATAKKLHREQRAFPLYREAATEEFGDTLWYLAALFRRADINPIEIFTPFLTEDLTTPTNVAIPMDTQERAALDQVLLMLGTVAAALLEPNGVPAIQRANLQEFVRVYIEAVRISRMSLVEIAHANMKKARSRFGKLDLTSLPVFDGDLAEEERLPDHFEIHITQRLSGKSYLRWNGVFIGDPLTDNIEGSDGYRFHDVFHLAHAAILNWSPVVRALIKHKRKSVKAADEGQDSGRPIVVEEGLTAWLFAQAKALDFFEGQTSVSYDILKTIGGFVKGYEVEKCPLKLWEYAILEGYGVFRKVRDNNGGIVIGDRSARTLLYRPIKKINV